MTRLSNANRMASFLEEIKYHNTVSNQLRVGTEEMVLKNITEIDFTSSPVRIKKSELQRSLYDSCNIIAFAESILQHASVVLEDDIVLGLLNSKGTLISSANKRKIGLCCSESTALVRNSSELTQLLITGHALQINSGSNSQSGGVAILDKDGTVQYHLIARNDTGPLTTNAWNVLYLVAQLIQQQYYTLQMLEENTNSFMRAIQNPVLLLDNNVKVLNANESCLILLNIGASDLSTELYNISLLSNNHHIKSISTILNLNDQISIQSGSTNISCDIRNRQLIDTPYGKRLVLLIDNTANTSSIISQWPTAEELTGTRSAFDEIIGHSPIIQSIKSLAKQVAKSSCTILIEGDTGTGKELLAEAIHKESERQGRFVAINCGGIPSELLQSELFGYEEGAFTGAKKGGKLGQFETADGGTLFLDEIGEMPIEMQVSLLRFLQNKTVTRIGGEIPKKIDVRIIAATNRNLKNEVEKGHFREDLFYRLNVMNFQLPALRDRRDDIPLIASYLLNKLCNQYDVPVMTISTRARNDLMNYDWLGNIRELANVIERAFLLRKGEELVFGDILKAGQVNNEILDRSETLNEAEKQVIEQYLQMNHGKVSLTADALHITRQTLSRKIKKLNINRNAFLSETSVN